MTRLSILVGIGLMLVGAMAYALPARQEYIELVPAIAGVFVAAGGMTAASRDHLRKHFMHLNAMIALLMLVWSAIKIIPDWRSPTPHTQFVADLDVLGLSAVFLYFAIRSFIEARRNRQAAAQESVK